MQRFCGHCGTRLQPPRWNPAEGSPLPVSCRPDCLNPHLHKHQPENPRIKDAGRQVNKTMAADKKTRPLRREILKLLSSLVEQQSVNN
jgi:hypothetical protein